MDHHPENPDGRYPSKQLIWIVKKCLRRLTGLLFFVRTLLGQPADTLIKWSARPPQR